MTLELEALRSVVSARILADAAETSRRLSDLGIPHVLIGGLAVGIHARPRATEDVDFMVGVEAFQSTTPLLVYRPWT